MIRPRFLLPALLLLVGCHKMDDAGNADVQFTDGLIHQVQLSDQPIPTSDARIAALGRTQVEPAPAAPPAPEATPELVAEPPAEEPAVAVVDEPAADEPTGDEAPADSPEGREDAALADQVAAEAAAQEAAQAAVLANSPLAGPTPIPTPEPAGDDDDDSAAEELTAEALVAAAVEAVNAAEATAEATAIALPEAPDSDLDALVALASATVDEDAGAAIARGSLDLAQCEPAEPVQLRESVRDMALIRTWPVDGRMRAEVQVGDAVLTVVQGDRLGPDGGRVVRISRDEILVGEIGFDLNGEAGIFTRAVRLR